MNEDRTALHQPALHQQIQLLHMRVRRTQRLLGGMGVLLAAIALGASSPSPRRERFTEIDVERINIVERDGSLRLVISNRERSPAPMVRTKVFGGYPGGNRPGLIFYNDEGTENGGFISSGRRKPDGTFEAEHSLTFDQFDQDQIVALQYIDANGRRRHGLQILDRTDRSIVEQDSAWKVVDALRPGPERDAALRRFRTEFPVAQRLYVGRDRNKAAIITLGDAQGRTRLRLLVDSVGNPSLSFLDEAGRVVLGLPDSARNSSR